MINITRTYPLSDRVPPEIKKSIPLSAIRARWTGEKRCPKAGEWFLSGSIIEAYRSYADLSTEHYIAELVEVKPIYKIIQVIK